MKLFSFMILWGIFNYFIGANATNDSTKNSVEPDLFFQIIHSDTVFFLSLISFTVLAIFLQYSFKKNNVPDVISFPKIF